MPKNKMPADETAEETVVEEAPATSEEAVEEKSDEPEAVAPVADETAEETVVEEAPATSEEAVEEKSAEPETVAPVTVETEEKTVVEAPDGSIADKLTSVLADALAANEPEKEEEKTQKATELKIEQLTLPINDEPKEEDEGDEDLVTLDLDMVF